MADYERPPRVLVIEDDDAIAQVLQRSLRMEGYEVRIAGDGVVALDEAHAFLPDLVILGDEHARRTFVIGHFLGNGTQREKRSRLIFTPG